MNPKRALSRRACLKGLGAFGAAVVGFTPHRRALAASAHGFPHPPRSSSKAYRELAGLVFKAPLIDTHEHLVEEKERLAGPTPPNLPCDDWALLFSHYLKDDLLVAGMPKGDLDKFLSPALEPRAKWPLLAPYWPAVKNTGFAQAVRITVRELYGVDEISSASLNKLQSGYEKTRRPGFYRRILQDYAGIESCQVNRLGRDALKQSDMPDLLMQDISIVGMFAGPSIGQYAPAAGIDVKGLGDWHRVIDWWFDHYSKDAVAVKSQQAYSRDIDYARVPAEKAEPIFAKLLQKQRIQAEERKALEDHLFWHAVDKATAHGLPVKLHTGYYAGRDSMPLARLQRNAGSAAELCRLSPDTRFVFMHICYPYYEEILAVAKQWTNAYVDMCWSWIINPVAAKDYLKKHIVTAPANKLLPFGGDYVPVELVLGHSIIARQGIVQALSELVEEGWLSLADASELVDPITHGNATQLFQLPKKRQSLSNTGSAR
jgi:uncharacterized protein